MRNLLRMVRSNGRGNTSTNTIADYLATLNNDVATVDQSVGPRCIVAWRFRKGGSHKGGGGHVYYTGLKRDANSPPLPTIGIGMDVRALVEAIMPRLTSHMEETLAGNPVQELDRDAINAELARLPHGPDEKLR